MNYVHVHYVLVGGVPDMSDIPTDAFGDEPMYIHHTSDTYLVVQNPNVTSTTDTCIQLCTCTPCTCRWRS